MIEDIIYINHIFAKHNITGWEFLQANPNNTYTFGCTTCKCDFALPNIDSIANYHYCPCCAKYMKGRSESNCRSFLSPQAIDYLKRMTDSGITFEELVSHFEIPEDQIDMIKKMLGLDI